MKSGMMGCVNSACFPSVLSVCTATAEAAFVHLWTCVSPVARLDTNMFITQM